MARKEIISKIEEFYQNDEALNISAMKRNHPELLKAVYEVQPFWGWKQALDDTGINYSDIRFEFSEELKCEVCGKSYKQLANHLRFKHGIAKEEYAEDYPDADFIPDTRKIQLTETGLFGSRKPEGLLLDHWEPFWTKEYLLDRVGAYRKLGLKINAANITTTEEPMMTKGLRFFGSWKVVLDMLHISEQAAKSGKSYVEVYRNSGVNIDSAKIRSLYPSPESVIKEVTHRYEAGEIIAARLLSINAEKNGSRLYRAALKWFGTWEQVLKKAGVPLEELKELTRKKQQKYASQEEVIAEIRRRSKLGLSLELTPVQKGEQHDIGLFLAARRYFGDWELAVHEAGFQLKGTFNSGEYYQSQEAVVQAILQRYEAGESLKGQDLAKSDDLKIRALYIQAYKIYGNWTTALENILPNGKKRYYINSYYQSQELVSEGILKRQVDGLSLKGIDLSHSDDPQVKALYYNARKFYGSWGTALKETLPED